MLVEDIAENVEKARAAFRRVCQKYPVGVLVQIKAGERNTARKYLESKNIPSHDIDAIFQVIDDVIDALIVEKTSN